MRSPNGRTRLPPRPTPAQDPRFATDAELEGERATLLDYLRAYRLSRFGTESRPVAFGELLQKLRHAARAEVVEAHPARHDRDAGHLVVHLTAALLELG